MLDISHVVEKVHLAPLDDIELLKLSTNASLIRPHRLLMRPTLLISQHTGCTDLNG